MFKIYLLLGLASCFVLVSCAHENTVEDIDGNIYQTVKIGNQVWMTKNLRTTRYRNGDFISTNLIGIDWNIYRGAMAVYPYESVNGINSEAQMVATYGILYNWYAVNDGRGLCPKDWRVPSDEDWETMEFYIESQGYPNINEQHGAGNTLKSRRQVNSSLGAPWATNEQPRWENFDEKYGTDKYGFSGLPGGIRSSLGGFFSIGRDGVWWSTTEVSNDHAITYGLSFNNGLINRSHFIKNAGLSIRCLRD